MFVRGDESGTVGLGEVLFPGEVCADGNDFVAIVVRHDAVAPAAYGDANFFMVTECLGYFWVVWYIRRSVDSVFSCGTVTYWNPRHGKELRLVVGFVESVFELLNLSGYLSLELFHHFSALFLWRMNAGKGFVDVVSAPHFSRMFTGAVTSARVTVYDFLIFISNPPQGPLLHCVFEFINVLNDVT